MDNVTMGDLGLGPSGVANFPSSTSDTTFTYSKFCSCSMCSTMYPVPVSSSERESIPTRMVNVGDSTRGTPGTAAAPRPGNRRNRSDLIQSQLYSRLLLLGSKTGGAFSDNEKTENSKVKLIRAKFRCAIERKSMEIREEQSDSFADEYKEMSDEKSNGNDGEAMRFVSKVYDRTVDVSRFRQDAPLYTVVRDWVANKPIWSKKSLGRKTTNANQTNSETSESYETSANEATQENVEVPGVVTKLPPPVPLAHDDIGNPIRLRVPKPLPPECLPFFIGNDDLTCERVPPATLFQHNLDRWKMVRLSWKEACRLNESRFAASFSVLETAFKPIGSKN